MAALRERTRAASHRHGGNGEAEKASHPNVVHRPNPLAHPKAPPASQRRVRECGSKKHGLPGPTPHTREKAWRSRWGQVTRSVYRNRKERAAGMEIMDKQSAPEGENLGGRSALNGPKERLRKRERIRLRRERTIRLLKMPLKEFDGE